MPLIEEDEVQKISSRFSVSTSVYPSLYTIELTPMEEETSMKLKGRVVIEFIYNGSYPLLHLVLNAKGILVSKAKLVSFEKPVPGNVHSRRRREEYPEIETPDSNNSTETTPSDFETTISIGNGETDLMLLPFCLIIIFISHFHLLISFRYRSSRKFKHH